MQELTDEEVEQLLEEKAGPKQVGPLRFHDTEARCASRGCSSPTYLRVQGVPKCGTHALIELNTMLVEAGFLGIQNAR